MKRDADKETFWRKTIAEASASGQSVREFCRERRMKEAQWYFWRRAIQARDGKAADRSGFVELVRAAEREGGAGVSIRLDDGIRILLDRGFDVAALKAALAAVCEAGRA